MFHIILVQLPGFAQFIPQPPAPHGPHPNPSYSNCNWIKSRLNIFQYPKAWLNEWINEYIFGIFRTRKFTQCTAVCTRIWRPGKLSKILLMASLGLEHFTNYFIVCRLQITTCPIKKKYFFCFLKWLFYTKKQWIKVKQLGFWLVGGKNSE
jgi:hypothetical protein